MQRSQTEQFGVVLAHDELQTIIQIGNPRCEQDIDSLVVAKLFARGIVYVRTKDRRIAFTEEGQQIHDEIVRP